MEDWQTRVIKEREELNVKLATLAAFISSSGPQFNGLSQEDKDLLRQQRNIMFDYSTILEARIQRFPK